MQRRGLLIGSLAATALVLSGPALSGTRAAQGAAARGAARRARDWSATVTTSEEGYLVRGNPQATVRLVEYVSYSCPHCGIFEMQGGDELVERFIAPGLVSFEIRPFYLNEIDKTLSLIAYCGGPARFFGNTAFLLKRQHEWLRSPTRAQAQRWSVPDWLERAKAMTEDLGLYTLMEQRGLRRAQIDRCLADVALVARLQQGTEDAFYKGGVKGTPTFRLNGELVPENVWPALRERLSGIMKAFV